MDKKEIEEVVFLEIKSRNSQLNHQEKCLKDAIDNKRINANIKSQ